MTAPSIHTPDHVSGEQYRYALTNFAIAHQKVEEQRGQLEEQERQIARLHARIAALEGSTTGTQPLTGPRIAGGSSVDDFSIKNTASQLERTINRWASEVLRIPPAPPAVLQDAALADLTGAGDSVLYTDARPMMVQSLLRHAMSEVISDGIINCLIVTSSAEANIQLTRIHEHLFSRDPTVAAVWRRQTFSAAVENIAPETTRMIFEEHVPSLAALLSDSPDDPLGTRVVFEDAYKFSRMLHGAPATAGPGADAFYRSFVPELASTLYPRQVELVKRCRRSERGELDRVGATIFPGLVKVSHTPTGPGIASGDTTQTVVRRAQVICECALEASVSLPPPPLPSV
ncbi:hypothetical protein B0F90DRAFT_1707956 [Multifurca ochricompacta]|uniref:Uncharacterized protein n=1 Tax=Multifurca ochricompacta TaxID=376703 RepID=A0AAD4M6A9_9AGAM|nr:hypothetical protein B0F90DRAFT_1707956 [Multifurca ochricompacta]